MSCFKYGTITFTHILLNLVKWIVMMFEHNKRIFWVNEIKPSAKLGVKSAANIINSIFIVRQNFLLPDGVLKVSLL